MKSFTAKEFSRCPAQVYDAARMDGEVEIKHDRFSKSFTLKYEKSENEFMNKICTKESIIRMDPYLSKGDEFVKDGFICKIIDKTYYSNSIIDSLSKIGDVAFIDGYEVCLIGKAPD